MQKQQGNILIPIILVVIFIIAANVGYNYFFPRTNTQKSDSNQNISNEDTSKVDFSDSGWEEFCDGYYLSDNSGTISLNKQYELEQLGKKAHDLGFRLLYTPERFHQGGPLQSLVDKDIPIQTNNTFIHKGVTYKTTKNSYEAFAPQLRLEKKIDGGIYRMTIDHHWNLEGSQTISLTTNSLSIPVMGGQKTDRVSDEVIIRNFKNMLTSLEIESNFLKNMKVSRNGCGMPNKDS